jgi:hypothetical protein
MLKLWDTMLLSGQRIVGNGGSDLHGTDNTSGFASGTPTTVVHAEALSKRAVIDALKRGRSFVTRLPDGVEVYLTGTCVDGQRQIMGGTLYGAPTDVAEFEILVRRAGGMRLTVLRDGVVASVVPLTSDEQVVPFSTPVGSGGFVRVEVRGEPFFGGPSAPLASRTDMEAFSNPVFLEQGAPPSGTTADSTRPPTRPGPRRTAGGPPAQSAASERPRTAASPASSPPGGERLPATGGGDALPAAGLAAAAAATVVHRLSYSEFRLRAASGDSLRGMRVALVGEVTAEHPDGFTLSRWIPGCCSSEAAVDVRVRAGSGVARTGTWWEVQGQWTEATGASDIPELRADLLRPLSDPPPRREDLA